MKVAARLGGRLSCGGRPHRWARGAMGVGAIANVILAETVIADLEGLEVLTST